jgi:hypothetical protein
MVSSPPRPLIVLPGNAALQSMMSAMGVPVTLVAVCETPMLTMQGTTAWATPAVKKIPMAIATEPARIPLRILR